MGRLYMKARHKIKIQVKILCKGCAIFVQCFGIVKFHYKSDNISKEDAMKEREKEILDFIIENKQVSSEDILNKFQISKRTLYYDIKSINYEIKKYGQIKNINHKFAYVGSYSNLSIKEQCNDERFFNIENRKHYILYEIINEQDVTIDNLADFMKVSKNTIVQTIEEIKKDLTPMGLQLIYKKNYKIVGHEYMIRELFIILMQEDLELLSHINKKTLNFDKENNIKLTDYSLANLSKFVEFLNKRIEKNFTIANYKYRNEARKFYFYNSAQQLLPKDANDDEKAYLCAYISTLSSLNSDVKEQLIENYVNKLVSRFEAKTAITLESKEEFKKNIKRHLLSSYYRIKFRFPISSAALNEIKIKHNLLYTIIKDIIQNEKDFPDLKGIREEEIALIAAYFGGYLKGSRESGVRKNRVILVCPNGLTVSKILEIQLIKYVPTVEIIDTISLKELSDYKGKYDYIVSTIELDEYENVIIVNPVLTKIDIELLQNRLINFKQSNLNFDFELIMQVIKKNANIINEEKLKEDLVNIIYRLEEREEYQPMLKDLLNEKRINKVKKVSDWKEAIKLAAAPLLEDGSIDSQYVDGMIESVNKYGPYIVLADRFALPHASSKVGVNRLAMSLLSIEEEVDLLGEPVNVFMVLAAIDNTSHIKALADLSELLYEEKNLEVFKIGNKEEILNLINGNN